MRKLRKAIPLALAMSVALTMTPIRASAEEPTQVQAEQSDLVEENESLSDEADKDNEGYKLVFEDDLTEINWIVRFGMSKSMRKAG